jgi:DNA-directed RNA polymerase specialized sigma24 family protein
VTRAAHLRALAAAWAAEARDLGARPRLRLGRCPKAHRDRSRPWQERHDAIAGALALAQDLEAASLSKAATAAVAAGGTVEQRAVALRAAGLTFAGVAATLGIPVGSAKTWVRRARLGGVA